MKPFYRYAIYALVAVIALQQAVIYFRARADHSERLRAANLLAAASKQEDWLRGQLRVSARYLYQGQVQLVESQRRENQRAVLTAHVHVDRRSFEEQDSIVVSDTLHFESQFGTPRSLLGTPRDTVGLWSQVDVSLLGYGPIPGHPIGGRIDWRVEVAPIPLNIGVACEGPNARLYVSAPRYAHISLENGRMTDEVCNPPPHWSPFSFKLPSLPWAAALVGVGFLLRGSVH